MVMSSEPRENTRNGKSRGNSPNNASVKSIDSNSKLPAENLTPEVSDDDNSSKKNLGKNNGKPEFEEKIRVGKNYQVVVPEMVPMPENYPDKALLVWSPAKWIPESKLEEYISLAKDSYSYNAEQALGMLFWHKHDLEKAVVDLANFTPYPDEWTKEEKALFAQAFQFHGKCFHRIRQMLPDKSIASLVKFYYSWKKTRREKKKKSESENGSPDESEVEEKIDSDDEVQVKDAEIIGDINEIIGISKENDNAEEGTGKTGGKTSIMTTSRGKTLKRKFDDDVVVSEEAVEAEESIPEKKKLAEEQPEISITPIRKSSVVA